MITDQLAAERDAVLDRLEKRWAWCQANPHSASIDKRTDSTLVDLKAYEDLEQALGDAA